MTYMDKVADLPKQTKPPPTHRPGPWHARFSEMGFAHEIYDYAGGNVATVTQWSESHEQTRATAHLIAAAPDMLTALKVLLAAAEYADQFGLTVGTSKQDITVTLTGPLNVARAAIAAAEGRDA